MGGLGVGCACYRPRGPCGRGGPPRKRRWCVGVVFKGTVDEATLQQSTTAQPAEYYHQPAKVVGLTLSSREGRGRLPRAACSSLRASARRCSTSAPPLPPLPLLLSSCCALPDPSPSSSSPSPGSRTALQPAGRAWVRHVALRKCIHDTSRTRVLRNRREARLPFVRRKGSRLAAYTLTPNAQTRPAGQRRLLPPALPLPPTPSPCQPVEDVLGGKLPVGVAALAAAAVACNREGRGSSSKGGSGGRQQGGRAAKGAAGGGSGGRGQGQWASFGGGGQGVCVRALRACGQGGGSQGHKAQTLRERGALRHTTPGKRRAGSGLASSRAAGTRHAHARTLRPDVVRLAEERGQLRPQHRSDLSMVLLLWWRWRWCAVV